MRVVYFTESLYPHVDGVSQTLARLFSTLERCGVDYHVFSPFLPDSEVPWRPRVAQVSYVPIPFRTEYRISLPYARSVKGWMAEERVDLVHLVSPSPMASWAKRLARKRGIPYVASFHTHFVSYFRHYGASSLEDSGWEWLRRFYDGCAAVYAPSPNIMAELQSQGIENVELWSRGVDLSVFSFDRRDESLRAEIGVSEEVPLLLFVSRLVKEKDLADLIAVDQLLRERKVQFRLVMVGEGPMREELEEALPEAIFAGHQSGSDLAKWYASADAFVFPSTTETLGNVVLEALASGLPPVVVNRGGPQDLVSHGDSGFVAEANDPLDIALYVEKLLTQPELRRRMSAMARESVAPWNWEAINEGLIDSYRQIIALSAQPFGQG